MSKFFSDVKFTKAERAAIEKGWYALEDIAERTGSTAAQYLKDAFKFETGKPMHMQTTFAKGMLCEWMTRALAEDEKAPGIATLYGVRMSSIYISIIAATAMEGREGRRPTDAQRDALKAASEAKHAAFERSREPHEA